jgi:acyl carrier protein
MPASDGLKARVKEMLVRQLRLKMTPLEIADDSPLFGPDGLGLDSIDVLEVVASVEKEFGVAIQSQEGEQVLRSVSSLAEFLEQKGAGGGR